jgi:hypothetical protein
MKQGLFKKDSCYLDSKDNRYLSTRDNRYLNRRIAVISSRTDNSYLLRGCGGFRLEARP